MNQVQTRPVTVTETGLSDAQRAEISALLRPKVKEPLVDYAADDVVAAPVLHNFGPAAVWEPASTKRIRIAEGVIATAVMAYFATGLYKALAAA